MYFYERQLLLIAAVRVVLRPLELFFLLIDYVDIEVKTDEFYLCCVKKLQDEKINRSGTTSLVHLKIQIPTAGASRLENHISKKNRR